jgi:hypothetical protein
MTTRSRLASDAPVVGLAELREATAPPSRDDERLESERRPHRVLGTLDSCSNSQKPLHVGSL